MKPFSQYVTAKPDKSTYRDSLRQEIESLHLPVAEKHAALKQIESRASAWMRTEMKRWREENARLQKEFFSDAAKELGYAEYLSPKGIASLHKAAWKKGWMKGGYPEVLAALQELVKTMVEPAHKKANK